LVQITLPYLPIPLVSLFLSFSLFFSFSLFLSGLTGLKKDCAPSLLIGSGCLIVSTTSSVGKNDVPQPKN
jgi:hypothetical protein